MPYIGNTPADKFLTLAKQSFSTSATTSYTLDSSISSTQDIALFINNVRQSPVDAYTVSGTALTLTSATAGTDEMYCVYLGKTVGTVNPPNDSVGLDQLSATGTPSSSNYLRGDNSWASAGTTINNNADNRVITGSGTANTLNGEADLTFDSGKLLHIGTRAVPAASGTTQTYHTRYEGGNNGVLDIGRASGSYYAWIQNTDKSDLSVNYPLALNGNGGKVWMGTTSQLDSDSTLQVKSNTNGGEAITAQVHTNGNSVINFNNASSNEAGFITVQANGSAVAYNTSSDYRLKENEVAISDGITRLKTLKPYKFNFKTKPDVKVDGFFAHEVTAVPEAITGEKDGEKMQGIDQSKLVPLLTAALQESITKIETLETKVTALENK